MHYTSSASRIHVQIEQGCNCLPRFVYHPHVAEAFIVNGGTIAFGDENKRGDAWVQKHDAFAKAKGLGKLDSQEKREQEIRNHPIGGVQITPRMKSATLLLWSLAMQEGDDPRVQDLIFQIDQEVDRLPQQLGRLPCMTPKGVYYSTQRNQVLNANTCAGTQGFPEDVLTDYFEHPEAGPHGRKMCGECVHSHHCCLQCIGCHG